MPLLVPCLNHGLTCRGYTDHLGGLCPDCRRSACPECGVPQVHIKGKAYRVTKRTNIPKRYIHTDDEELFCPPVPLVIVERK